MRLIQFFVFIVLFLPCSCKEEIDVFLPDDQVCINAIMEAGTTDNRIYCTRISDCCQYPITDATIKIFKNGLLAELIEHDAEGTGIYKSSITFSAKDLVRIEVSCPELEQTAVAETIVPESISIESFDTLTTFQSFIDGGKGTYCQMKLGLHKQNEGSSYYRVMSGIKTETIYTIAEVDFDSGNVITERDSIVYDSVYSIEILNDLALTDGRGYVESYQNDVLGYVVVYKNHYRLFSDAFFSDNRYTLTYYTVNYNSYLTPSLLGNGSLVMKSPGHFLYGQRYKVIGLSENKEHQFILYCKKHDAALFYDVISMTSDEFDYLKGLGIREDIDEQNEPFMNPVILPQSFQGAAGIFYIENHAKGEIKLSQD